jgi:phospholipid/cholesterol/gamma-HCH transport system substrate-binding protein
MAKRKMTWPGFVRRPDFRAHRYFWIGIAGGVVVIALIVGSSLYSSAGVGDQDIKAEFAQAAGLRKGDPVDVAGLQVGQVRSMRLAGDHVEVSLNVHSSVHLGPDAHAAIKVSTLLGSKYVDLAPGNGAGLPGDQIAESDTSVPYDLADVIQVGTPKFENLDTARLAQTLDTLNQQFGDTSPMAAQALDSIGALTTVINNRRDEFDGLLKNLSKVTSLLSDDRNQLLSLVTQGDDIGAQVLIRQRLVTQLLDNVASLSRQLQAIGAQNHGEIGPTIGQLDTITQGLNKNKQNLDMLLQILPVTVRQFTNTGGDGNYLEMYMPWSLLPDNMLCAVGVVPGCK